MVCQLSLRPCLASSTRRREPISEVVSSEAVVFGEGTVDTLTLLPA
jgi:hypothetical protein